MQETFKNLLDIQELDIKMIRLLKVKKQRKNELDKLRDLKNDIENQTKEKSREILEIKKEIRMGEGRIQELQTKVVQLEERQSAVKKMDEFNALTQEMTAAGRERNAIEHKLSDLTDQLTAQEDLLTSLQNNLQSAEKSGVSLEKEINHSIQKINEEGTLLLRERAEKIHNIPADIFPIYDRLLKNKKDRVLVPIENRTCSGCHIVLTPQHENLVRKQTRLVFCEHCSRILYWQEATHVEGEEGAAPRRRRRKAPVAS